MNAETRWADVKRAVGNIAWCVAGAGLAVMVVGGLFIIDPLAIAGIALIVSAPLFYTGSWAAFRRRHMRAIARERRALRIAALEREAGL